MALTVLTALTAWMALTVLTALTAWMALTALPRCSSPTPRMMIKASQT
jgi:hypothetical protein